MENVTAIDHLGHRTDAHLSISASERRASSSVMCSGPLLHVITGQLKLHDVFTPRPSESLRTPQPQLGPKVRAVGPFPAIAKSLTQVQMLTLYGL